MESNKKMNILTKIKKGYRKFMFTEDAVKRMEETDMKPFKERVKSNLFSYLQVVLAIIIIIVLIFFSVKSDAEKKAKEQENAGSYLTSELEGEKRDITSGELTKYMIDTLNNSYVKIAQTKLGDQVAYSLTYRYDVIPEGEMTASKYFVKGEMAAILINGYPNVGYEEMNLKNEEEAYLATQLAVYALVSQKQYSMANGTFSLDSIKPSSDEYAEMVQRILVKAKELLEYALDNPYEIKTDASISGTTRDIKIDGDVAIVGPFTSITETDEYTKAILKDSYNPYSEVDVKSFIDNTKAVVLDENGNEVSNVENGEKFYIKIEGTEKIFSQFKISSYDKYLVAYIYSTKENKKKYVLLEDEDITFIDVNSIFNNVDNGTIKIAFKTEDDEYIDDVGYYIYDENDNLIQEIEGYLHEYYFTLAEGNYYIKVYDVPKGYFLEDDVLKFTVTKNEESSLDVYMDSTIGLK
jgi:TQXA domain-containing protein